MTFATRPGVAHHRSDIDTGIDAAYRKHSIAASGRPYLTCTAVPLANRPLFTIDFADLAGNEAYACGLLMYDSYTSTVGQYRTYPLGFTHNGSCGSRSHLLISLIGDGPSVFDLSVSAPPPARFQGPGPLKEKQKQNVF